MVDAEGISFPLLFEYTREEHGEIPLSRRLEQERAARGTSHTDWASLKLIISHDGRVLNDRREPIQRDFPVRILWRGTESLSMLATTDAQPQLGNTPALQSPDQQAQALSMQPHVRALDRHASDAIRVYLLKLRRIPAALRSALEDDTRLQGLYVDLRDRPGRGDAKMVCHPEDREAVETYLITNGIELEGQNQRLVLNQMQSFHLLVSAEFLETVEGIIRALPRNKNVIPKQMAHAIIRPVNLMRTPSSPHSESAHVGHGGIDRSGAYPGHGVQPTTLQQTAAVSSSSAPSEIPSRPSPLQAAQSPEAISPLPGPSTHQSAPGESAAASTDAAEDILPTELDSSEEELEQETATIHQPHAGGGTVIHDINHRVTQPLVIDRTFFVVPVPTTSEGQRTASTGQRLGLNPRIVRQRVDDSLAADTDTQASAVPSQSLPSSVADTESLAPGVHSQDSMSLSLGMCNLESQS